MRFDHVKVLLFFGDKCENPGTSVFIVRSGLL